MKKIFILAAWFTLISSSLAQTCQIEGHWQLVSGFEEAMTAGTGMEDTLLFKDAEGTFNLLLAEIGQSDDGITAYAQYEASAYKLNFDIDAGGGMSAAPFSITMDGVLGEILYAFWDDGTVDINGIEDSPDSDERAGITISAELMGMPMPTFNTNEFIDLDQPGLSGTYECRGDSQLFITVQANVESASVYPMFYVRVGDFE